MELIAQGVPTAEISRRLRMQEETVTRWKLRNEETGMMEERKRGRPAKPPPPQKSDTPKKIQRPPGPRRKRVKQMSDIEKGKILMGAEMGMPVRTIAKKVHHPKSMVQRQIRQSSDKASLEKKSGPGRGAKRKTTKRDDRHYKLAVVRDKDVFAPEATREVTDESGKPVLDPRNVQTRLHEQGLRVKKKRKKPYMTEEQKRARLAWAKEHWRWTIERWRRILWSDESPFTVWPSPKCGKVWVHDRVGLDPRQIEETKKHGSGHITVWGCFSASGIGTLRRMRGKINAEAYHTVLVREVLPKMRELTGNDETPIVWLFQQDNASVHKAKICTDYLQRKQKEEGFEVLKWPSQSPDLNPIENLWSTLKDQMRKRKDIPKDKDELWTHLQEEWANLKEELLGKLAESLPQRCQDVIAARGGPTHH